MKEVVTEPFLFFLTSVLFGIALFAFYDIFRALRSVFHHRPIMIAIEDIGFALTVAVTSFLFLCTYNYGELRSFFFLGIFLGMILYHIKLSRYIRHIWIYIFSWIRHFLIILYHGVTRPMIYIQRNIRWRLKKEKKNITMALKSQPKRGGQSGTKKKEK